jgi:regulator of RNase E activity RraA
MGVFTAEDLARYTPDNPYDRFPDGRPKVPDEMLERLVKSASVEQAWDVLTAEGYVNQWEGDWKVLHPEKKLIGRAVTSQFVPYRPDVNAVIDEGARDLSQHHNLRVVDVLQEGDVAVVDLFGKVDEGTFVGGNLATSVYARTKSGIVVDGGIRDPEEIEPIEGFVAYGRDFHPSALANVMLLGINVPIRVGQTTVMPGDVVLGDSAGVIFIPPQLVEKIIESAEQVNLKDEFTKMMMLEGRYHPSAIYPDMSEEVKKEFEEWLQQQKTPR